MEQRDPGAIDGGQQDEEPVQGERGQDVQEADEAGLAGTAAGGGPRLPPSADPKAQPLASQ
jgi:hypothetical protein